VTGAVDQAIIKARFSITTFRSMPLSRAQAASIWPILRAASGDPMLLHPAYVSVRDLPGLPRVLLIGDSISIGYTVPVRRQLKGKANVHRPQDNCASTWKGLENLERWLADGNWKVIVFNFGLHDSVMEGSRAIADLDQYSENLRKITLRLAATGARLIWATTTPVPEKASVPLGDMPNLDPGKSQIYHPEEIPEYNARAAAIMRENAVEMVDLYEFALPQLASLQAAHDVHFTKDGYAALGGKVAGAIAREL
jgi:hypothetical protein